MEIDIIDLGIYFSFSIFVILVLTPIVRKVIKVESYKIEVNKGENP